MRGLSYECLPDVSLHQDTIARILAENPPPVFLAEKRILADRYERLTRCLDQLWSPSLVAYSFKTNYLVAKSNVMKELGAWAEVVSDREYLMARSLGNPGDRIVFNGPCKTDELLRQALDEGALINVNDHSELARLAKLVAGGTQRHKIGIRVSSTITGLGSSRFGFSLDDDSAARAVAEIAKCPELELVGLHSHLLGDTDEPGCYGEAARKVATFLKQYVPDHQRSIEYLDMGGGYPSSRLQPYTKPNWNPRPIEEYVAAIVSELAPLFPEQRPRLILEPGRYLVGDAFLFVSRVSDRRRSEGRQVVLSNASISMVPLTHYSPQAIRAFSDRLVEKTASVTPTTIWGSSCREDDLLYEGDFPEVRVGDLLIHYAMGAYNSSLSPDFIFDAPEAVFF